jgi:hypothetical protein
MSYEDPPPPCPPPEGGYPPPPPPPPATPPEPEPAAPKPNWFTRHPVITGLGIVAIAGIVAAGVAGGGDEGETSTAGETTDATETTETAETTEAPATTTTTEPPTTTTAPPTPAVLTLEGGGDMSTDPFQLDGGRYAVHHSSGGDCFYGASLEATGVDVLAMHELGTGTGPVEGDTNAYNVEPGEYYARVITGPPPDCPWTITLTAAS